MLAVPGRQLRSAVLPLAPVPGPTCSGRQQQLPASVQSKAHSRKPHLNAQAAAAPVLERSAQPDSARRRSGSDKQHASMLPTYWSQEELDDAQMSSELKARRQRSNSLAHTSKTAQEGLDKQQPRRKKQSSRSRSHRGASRQGHTEPAAPQTLGNSTDALTQPQETAVCKAIQVSFALIVILLSSTREPEWACVCSYHSASSLWCVDLLVVYYSAFSKFKMHGGTFCKKQQR